MSVKKLYVNDANKAVAVGELWIDRAGNECFFRENGTISCRTVNNEASMTVQSEKDSCDFNLIFERYAKTGLMTNVRREPPNFGDFSNVSDYHDALLQIQAAEDSFMQLPATVRARFENDPAKVIEFLNDPQNRSEAVKMGLVASPQAVQVPQGVSSPETQVSG